MAQERGLNVDGCKGGIEVLDELLTVECHYRSSVVIAVRSCVRLAYLWFWDGAGTASPLCRFDSSEHLLSAAVLHSMP